MLKEFSENLIKLPCRDRITNKGDAGRVLVVGGNVGMCGAAAFSALAAYRTGCGLVDIYTHSENRIPLQILVPEAVISFFSDDGDYKTLERLVSRADAVLVGVGLGTGDESRAVLERIISTCTKPLVIDADGLNILAQERRLLKKLPPNTVLTPHLLELSRLTETDICDLKKDVFKAVEKTFSALRVFIAAKSDTTMIIEPNKEQIIIKSGDSSLSTGGTGDILAGMIASLIAQKMPVSEALPAAVWLHGEAGKRAGEKLGERSVIARDVINTLPEVLKRYSKK